MSCRLLVDPAALAAGPIEVTGDDHHYLFRVRRLRPGDRVILFDGEGNQALAVVDSVSTERALLRAAEVERAAPERRPELVVLQSLVKGERMEGCLSRLVELGVDEIVPVQAARSVVVLEPRRAEARRGRWQRIAEAAARQCRRSRVPDVAPVCDLPTALARAGSLPLRLLLWEAAGTPPLATVLPPDPPSGVAILVGPEGGFEDEEVAAAERAGFQPVSLGPRILRADNAAPAAAAIVGFVLGDLGSPGGV